MSWLCRSTAHVDQHDVAVFAHDLKDEFLLYHEAELVQALECHLDDPFGAALLKRNDLAALYVFSQKHAERERLFRVLRVGRDQA